MQNQQDYRDKRLINQRGRKPLITLKDMARIEYAVDLLKFKGKFVVVRVHAPKYRRFHGDYLKPSMEEAEKFLEYMNQIGE